MLRIRLKARKCKSWKMFDVVVCGQQHRTLVIERIGFIYYSALGCLRLGFVNLERFGYWVQVGAYPTKSVWILIYRLALVTYE